jgi:hypothetical protein
MTGTEKNRQGTQRMGKTPPKVFISHSSSDKDRFVLEFATRLRKHGVDAWVDCWEMNPGDSLVEKIWNEGLKNSDAVIVVLSESSVHSKWVREELNTAFVKKVEGQITLIPLRLDECEMPQCLISTLWKDIPDTANYDRQFGEIVNAVFGQTIKPPLGEPPWYVLHVPMVGLEPIDSLVLESACQTEIASGLPIADRGSFMRLLSQAITEDQIIESQQVLHDRGYVKLHYTIGRHIQTMAVRLPGFDLYANAHIPEFQALIANVGRQIVREGKLDNRAISDAISQPIRVVTHILAVLESKGWIETEEAYGGGYQHIDVLQVSPDLKRWLEKL